MQTMQRATTERPAAPDGRDVTTRRLQHLGVSRREAQVLGLVLAPYPNAEIAARLGISRRTVESHISALLRKLAVPDRPALIRTAARLCAETAPPTVTRDRRGPVAKPQSDKVRTDPATLLLQVARHWQTAQHSQDVERRRASITLHEAAAQRLDALAARWRSLAAAAPDEHTRTHHLEKASAARQRAQAARSRAAEARRRLHAGSIQPTR